MKKYILILFCFSFSGVFSQDCDVYIDRMAKEVEKNELDKAKISMKYFVTCKEQKKADSKVLKNLEQIIYITKFDGDVAIAYLKNGKNAIVSKDIHSIKELRYDDVYPFSEGLAHVRLDGKSGFIDKTGKEVISLKYDNYNPCSFSEGLVSVNLNGKHGYIDKTGKEVIPLKYDIASPFYGGLAQVALNGKVGFIDKTGKEIISRKYHDASDFYEDLALVMLNKKYGFIDKTGIEVIPLKYDFAGSFSEGLTWVKLNGKHGYIDKTGKELISLKYDDAFDFSEGLALVILNGKEFYINKEGICVKDCQNAPADHPRIK